MIIPMQGKPILYAFIISAMVVASVFVATASAQQNDHDGPVAEAGPTVDSADGETSAVVDRAEGSSRGALIASITIFVLAVFVGFEVITKVPPTLHTPLMSGSNAISGITLVGALLAAGAKQTDLAAVIAVAAVILAAVNVVGGFMVTGRMLAMFRKK